MIAKRQILIVEDNDLNRAMLHEILSGEYQVLEAENGQEALDILKTHQDNISIILLDVMMPVMDGYAFLERIKEEPELSLIPVIVMTQSDSEDDEVSALAHGATDFVPKPYRPQIILQRVANIIKLRETASIVNQLKYDRLTGLYSKEFFYRKVRERLMKDSDGEYVIVSSNIENFKLYNDIFGVQKGDLLLKEIAKSMQESSGKNAICGRFGSDRFLCLQEREQERKDRLDFFGKYTIRNKNVVMKWGIYEITDRTIPVERMCDRAFLAVDSIKGQYDRQFAVYDDSLRDKMLREKSITDVMETALDEEQFIVYFQPKYSLSEECMSGAEALVRWKHPERGFISPGEFIPLFEKNGFISRLDQYVWEKVCEKLREWKEKGYPLLPVSVNMSRADVYQMELGDILMGITQKYGIDPAYLHLEITESAYVDNPSQIINAVSQLRNLGFIIEMDDFGSGYSSLNMFNQMKIDVLKLDMKFIQNEMAKPASQSILSYVINMSHGVGLSVVAEGIESKEQMDRMRELGCDYMQGYYFAKPMPAEEYEILLKEQSTRFMPSVLLAPRKENNMRTLLVIDEDESYREKVREMFEEQFRILEAVDADGAISRIKEQEEDMVSVIILSMTLRDDQATVFLKKIRQNPNFWRIPILAIIPRGDMVDELPDIQDADDFLCRCHPLRDLRKRVEQLVGIVASRERELMLQNAARRDYLTGLLNRRGLQIALDSLRKSDMPLAVCLFDLDNLKKINDTKGHDTGDQYIKSFANLLKCKTRAQDILCRYGGDEFLVILKGINDEKDAMNKGKEICEAFHSACSGGIVVFDFDEDHYTNIIRCADHALLKAKQENKGGCCLWSESHEGINN